MNLRLKLLLIFITASLAASASREFAFSVGGTRSIVSDVGAISELRTSTVFSIEDPASLDFDCSEIKRRNSSTLQSIETKFAISLLRTCVPFAPGRRIDCEAGAHAPSKRALRPAAIAQDVGLALHSSRRRLRPGQPGRSMSRDARGWGFPGQTAILASGVL